MACRRLPGAVTVPLADYRFALRVALWLLVLPWRLRRRSFSGLAQDVTMPRPRASRSLSLGRAAYLVSRVSDSCPFRRWPFPRRCLRRSLALCRFLGALGYPVRLHLAVSKSDALFEAHTWVSVNGRPIDESVLPPGFVSLYEYPSQPDRDRLRCHVGSRDQPQWRDDDVL